MTPEIFESILTGISEFSPQPSIFLCGLSPCQPLLYNQVSYLHGKKHVSRRDIIGKVNEHSLAELWFDEGYIAYRERVQSFAFEPCTPCGGCELFQANEEDCYGNTFPSCGGCLRNQGVIQCP